MHVEPFKASVQYGDLKGTAAADSRGRLFLWSEHMGSDISSPPPAPTPSPTPPPMDDEYFRKNR